MPSSSGGGFGGGGSFGGGFHSSGGSGGPSQGPHYSNRPFAGATRYSYINRHGVFCVFYSVGRPTKMKLAPTIALLAFALVAIIVVMALVIHSSIPAKISERDCAFTGNYYEDTAGVITDAAALNDSFESFYKETGIQPYLYSIKSTEFPSQYGSITKYSLESFALDLYLDKFNDEGHWLIVFVTFEGDPYFGWIDMAGDDTRTIISDEFFNNFQKDMQTKLNAASKGDGITYEQAIRESIDRTLEYAFTMSSDSKSAIVFTSLFGLLFVGLIIYSIVKSVKQALMINGYLEAERSGQPINMDRNEQVSEEEIKPKREDDLKDPFS